MKKKEKLFLLSLLLMIFIFSCKKKSNETTNELKSKVTVKKKKVPRKFKTKEKEKYIKAKKNNLDVLKGESYFNLKEEHLQLRIPVTNTDFKIYHTLSLVLNGKKTIILTITDSKPVSISGSLGDFLLEEKISFSSFIGASLNLTKSDSLEVIVINDDSFASKNKDEIKTILQDFHIQKENNKIKIDYFKPREIGGGVIVEGP
ncbi:hypothetical protein [uncultured Polaribacter sp.]|uniref:hypothetical protein n=1 Tax=uncultured Polaribacter sp. TaxID=174711 RepID=UPI00260B3B04|nr:hypothetical protein [uncultured Polaribacter sp.]